MQRTKTWTEIWRYARVPVIMITFGMLGGVTTRVVWELVLYARS